jgi:putative tryptophan/tyrosine transport system ATP-binding protein
MTSPFGAANSDRPYLAHAAWVRAKLLLLDEHTAALDPKSADQVIRLTDDIVSRDKLTTLMVTHSMQQAASLGDRLVMMHRGWVIHDLRGAEKRRARVDDLLTRFEEVGRREQLDETATERCCGGHTSDQFLRS